MPYLGCETYWMCQGGIPLPMACSNNRIFDPNTLQCIADPGTTNCFGPTLRKYFGHNMGNTSDIKYTLKVYNLILKFMYSHKF